MSAADQFSSFMSEMKRKRGRQEEVDNERGGLTSHPHPLGIHVRKTVTPNLHVKATVWLSLVK